MAIAANIFAKCAPALGTNIKQCASVTLCSAIPVESGDLAEIFTKNGDFRYLDALFKFEFELKSCDAPQNGMYDFLMANKVSWGRKIAPKRANAGVYSVDPFVMGRRYWPINNAYWHALNGTASGGNWQIDVVSTTGVPFDVRTFIADDEVAITSETNGGSRSVTFWKIVSSTALTATHGRLVLSSLNGGSNLPADKLTYPVTGLLRRTVNNKNDTESFCNEPTTYTNWSNVPFWYGTSRITTCKSELYDQWRQYLLEGNPYYKEFQDLDEIEVNKQVAAEWQRRWADAFFFSKAASANQTLASYNSLPDITSAESPNLDVPTGAKCVGKRAYPVGVYEQLAECNRIADVQGATLILSDLFRSLYDIWRLRQSQGDNSNMIDLFMDTTQADNFNTAMIQYYNAKLQGTLRVNMNVGGDFDPTQMAQIKQAKFGFSYRTYSLLWPIGLKINVVTHFFFDDAISAALQAGLSTNLERNLWVLDFKGVYPFIVSSNRVVTNTNPAALQGVDATYACTMKIPTEQKTMTSMSWGVVVDCPASNLIIENLGAGVPDAKTDDGYSKYPLSGNATTTTPA